MSFDIIKIFGAAERTERRRPPLRAAAGGLPRAGRRQRRLPARPAAHRHRAGRRASSSDVAQLWDDLFIETCRRWVIPYIGDLVSNDLLYDERSRRDTAHDLHRPAGPTSPPVAIRTRPTSRRRSTTGAARARCRCSRSSPATSPAGPRTPSSSSSSSAGRQNLEHFRPQAAGFDVRSLERDERVDGAFDEASHTVDVRADRPVRGLAPIPQRRLLPLAARRLPAAQRPRAPRRARPGASTSARSATPRRSSRR